MFRFSVALLAAAALPAAFAFLPPRAAAQTPLLFQSPSVSRTQIAFGYAGHVWLVGRDGGEARRLTNLSGEEGRALFSPDGTRLAFWRNSGGNMDVYVAALPSSEPKRLTYHPKEDAPVGWTPDGKEILFTSRRASDNFLRLYAISADGGFERELPFPLAEDGAISPDGTRIAYQPRWDSTRSWRNYRGGTTTPIWIATLSDSRIADTVPRQNSNDAHPMWNGKNLYFTSDRTGTVNLFVYDTASKTVRQLTHFAKWDIKGVGAGDDAIVLAQNGTLRLFDLKTQQLQSVPVTVREDSPETKPRTLKAAPWIRAYDLSPTGEELIFAARGELLAMTARTGESRNLTQSSGVAERSPAWSPDGKSIACFSDESGEYQLHLRSATDGKTIRKIPVESHPSFYSELVWSPDGRKLAFSDKRLALWFVNLDKGTPQRIDVSTYSGQDQYFPAWSPDSRWLAYSKYQPNRLRALCLYSLDTAKTTTVTDGRSDVEFPVFDKNGQVLYFTSSADAGPGKVFGMSSFAFDVHTTRSVGMVILSKDKTSPLIPVGKREDLSLPLQAVRLDIEDIGQRIHYLPIPQRNYVSLAAGKPGILFLLESGMAPIFEGRGEQTLFRFDLSTRKWDKWIEDVSSFVLSSDGSTLLYQRGRDWAVAAADAPPKPGEGKVALDGLQIVLDPRSEWRQMFHESWRIMRDYFYDPRYHGQNLSELEKVYAAYLPNVATRSDLNTLFREMFSHMTVGHMQIGGGDVPPPATRENVGMLGADYEIANGRYRISRIYRGDNSSLLLTAPLAQPGSAVREGEYLLAVDGEEIKAETNLYRYFVGKAGKPVQLRIGAEPEGRQSRVVTVVPMPGENTLRQFDWVEGNRRKVAEMSAGRLGYLYLPDTGLQGYRDFVRDFYAQLDKEGLIIDERFNSGGAAADFILEALQRVPLSYYAFREGTDFPFPMGVVRGPKVMLINEYAGSGGDTLPWLFREAKIGTLVGMRTWGGGIGGFVPNPEFLDGGRMLAPNRAFFNPRKGMLDIENRGVSPDIEVELLPAEWRKGHDTQLEKAVRVALDSLRRNPPEPPKRPVSPAYP